MIKLLLSIVMSYVLGAIPFAFIIGKLVRKIDIRQVGSHNVGATNVFREIGKKEGAAVLFMDMAKGILSVTLIAGLFDGRHIPMGELTFKLALGLSVIVGHNWPIFLRFKGGRGVATGLGVLVGLSSTVSILKLIILLLILIWMTAVLFTGYVSVGSLSASISLPILMAIFNLPIQLVLFAIILCIIISYRHRPNIGRLLRREEKKINVVNRHKS